MLRACSRSIVVTLVCASVAHGPQELEFQSCSTQGGAPGGGGFFSGVIESLISINKKLGQPEAALGILKYAQKKTELRIEVGGPAVVKPRGVGEAVFSPLATLAPSSATGSERYDGVCVQVKESWLAKLGNWSEALELYQVRTLQTCRIELVCAVMMLTVGCWLSVAGASSRQPEGPGGHGGHHEVLGRAGAVGRGGSCPTGPQPHSKSLWVDCLNVLVIGESERGAELLVHVAGQILRLCESTWKGLREEEGNGKPTVAWHDSRAGCATCPS